MQEELLIAPGAGDWRGRRRHARQSYSSGGRRHLIDDTDVDRRVSNDTLAHLGAAGFELGLDERNHVRPRSHDRGHRGQNVAQRDERHVDDHQIDRAG